MKGTHQHHLKIPAILQKTAKMLSGTGSGNGTTGSGTGSRGIRSVGCDEGQGGNCSVNFFRKSSPQKMIVTSDEITSFFKLFDDEVIQDFLWMDCCGKTADKYLLAMVFAYFKRAQYTTKQYTRLNFFTALYLANDMEEDEEDTKYDIFPWALGRNWRNTYPNFLRRRDKLLRIIQYRAAVSRKCCDEVMGLMPDHVIWKRERLPHHGGAVRKYPDTDDDEAMPLGPDATPIHCRACEKAGGFAFSLDQLQLSPDSGFLYLSSCTESSEESTESIEEMDSSYSKLEDFPTAKFLGLCDATTWADE